MRIDDILKKKAKSGKRIAKKIRTTRNPINTIIMYHMFTFLIFSSFSLAFLYQMDVFRGWYSTLAKTHYYVFRSSRFMSDTFSNCKIFLSEVQDPNIINYSLKQQDILEIIKKLRVLQNESNEQREQNDNIPFINDLINNFYSGDLCDYGYTVGDTGSKWVYDLPFDDATYCPSI